MVQMEWSTAHQHGLVYSPRIVMGEYCPMGNSSPVPYKHYVNRSPVRVTNEQVMDVWMNNFS